MEKFYDSYEESFSDYSDYSESHKADEKNSKWIRLKVNELCVEPLDENSPLYGDVSAFASGVSEDAITDTALNLGLALRVDGEVYPIRETAYKTLLDRAKINGTVLPKLSRKVLSEVLNECLQTSNSDALVLVRDEKVSAIHSGDETDYSVLPATELLESLKDHLDNRFPNSKFVSGYRAHSVSSAIWEMPEQKDDLIGSYKALLDSLGKASVVKRLVPGIKFTTSDTGVSAAKVSAYLIGGQHPIRIGDCVAVDHRHKSSVKDFSVALDSLFAMFSDNIEKLKRLLDIKLDYPINAMTRICKKLSMPKKAAIDAIKMFEMAIGEKSATAHDVFMAMQEIPYNLKITEKVSESKLLVLEENMARVLNLNWHEFDLAKGVDY